MGKGINEKVKMGSPFAQKLFRWAIDYRMEAIKNGESTPIMDKIVFKKIRALLGGQMRLMLCGGAPLSKEVHDFMRVCIGAPLLQVRFQFNLYFHQIGVNFLGSFMAISVNLAKLELMFRL